MLKTLYVLTILTVASSSYAQQLSDLTFGPQQQSDSGGNSDGSTLDNIIAVVGDDVITRRELNNAGGKSKRQALQQLIMRKLLLQAAKNHNISVGDTAVNVAMKEPGNSRMGREAVRENLLIGKLQQQVVNGRVSISEHEVADRVAAQLKQLTDSVKMIDVLVKAQDGKDLRQARKVARSVAKQLQSKAPQSVASQYDNVSYRDLGWVELAKIPASFAEPLLDAPVGKFLQPIVDRDGIHILKILDKKQKTVKGGKHIAQTRASHILIRDQDNPQAEKQISAIYKQLQSGADFAKVAEQYSQDPGSSASGGDLGWVVAGQMVPSFEAMMNKTKAGAISKPFKSPFGYHIVKVQQRRKAAVTSRQALEQQVRQAIFQQRAAEEWQLWLSQLRDESYVEIRQRL